MVIYHAPVSAREQMAKASPEEAAKGMEPWFAWQKAHEGNIVDLGMPLDQGKKISNSGVSDSSRDVAGFSIIQAESLDEAVEMLKGHPHLDWMEGAEIEVHEFLPLPGME